MDDRLKRQLEFSLEIDKAKNIFRQTHLSGKGRRENDAGDTYAYDTEGLELQKEREDRAKERIFSILPDDQKKELIALFDEFEECKTAESKFAHAMDNLQPILLNNSNGGADWKVRGIKAEQVYKRQEKTKLGSDEIYKVVDGIIQDNIAKGNLRSTEESN